MKNSLKNILKLLGAFAWLIGTIGGFAYCAKQGQWLPAVCCLILGAMAFPTVKRWFTAA